MAAPPSYRKVICAVCHGRAELASLKGAGIQVQAPQDGAIPGAGGEAADNASDRLGVTTDDVAGGWAAGGEGLLDGRDDGAEAGGLGLWQRRPDAADRLGVVRLGARVPGVPVLGTGCG
jgi:hypothetical protein